MPSLLHVIRSLSFIANGPDGSRLLRKDPNGQKAAWKVREDLRKRLVDQLAKNGPDNLGMNGILSN